MNEVLPEATRKLTQSTTLETSRAEEEDNFLVRGRNSKTDFYQKVRECRMVYDNLPQRDIIKLVEIYRVNKQPVYKWLILLLDEVYQRRKQQGRPLRLEETLRCL